MSTARLGHALSFIVVLFPILFEYTSGISSLSLADIFLIIWLVCAIAVGDRRLFVNREYKSVRICLGYMYLMLFIQIICGTEISIVMKLVRYLLYMTVTAFFSAKYMDYGYTIKIYRFAAMAATFMVLIQICSFYFLGKQVSGFIPFLNRGEAVDYQTIQYLSESITTYRPCSFFSEPAIYSSYVAGMLTIELFSSEKKWRNCFFLTFGMALSTSSTSIIYLGLIWGLWGVWTNRSKLAFKKIGILFFLAVLLVLFSRTNSFKYIIDRLFTTGSGVSGRFDGYNRLFEVMKSDGIIKLLFGHTMYVDERIVYVPGWGSYLYSFGIVGLLLLIIEMIILFRHSYNDVGKFLIIGFSILSVGTVAMINYFAMIYLSLAIISGKESEVKD